MSMVITDPKGELYRKLAKYLEKEKEYDVKVFNLVNPAYSNGCKFIDFIEDETDAQIFSQIVIENTQLDRKSSGDEFWNRGEQNLLKALLLYTINYVDEDENKNMGFIYSCLASGNIKKINEDLRAGVCVLVGLGYVYRPRCFKTVVCTAERPCKLRA